MTEGQVNDLPLAGRRIILLRSPDQAQELKASLASLGAEVIVCPMISILPQKEITDQITEPFLQPFTTIIFTSANGVNVFMQTVKDKHLSHQLLTKKRLIAIGPKTAEVMRDQGLSPSDMPDKFVAEHILKLFQDRLKDEIILIPTAAGARKVLPEELEKRGAKVAVLPIYKTVMPDTPDKILIQNQDAIVFTSSSTADHFFQSGIYTSQDVTAFCIGDITRHTVEKYLRKNIFTSKESTAQSLIECLVSILNDTQKKIGYREK